MDSKEMLERSLKGNGLKVATWREGEDGLEAVIEGHWEVIHDDDDRGLYAGDEGQLVACVVGAPEYGNVRVHYSLNIDEYDSSIEVQPGVDIEQL